VERVRTGGVTILAVGEELGPGGQYVDGGSRGAAAVAVRWVRPSPADFAAATSRWGRPPLNDLAAEASRRGRERHRAETESDV
jgi:hypothetical protein